MKKRYVPILGVMLATAGIAQAAEPWQRPSSERGLMLYVSKPINSGYLRRPEPLMFGLRLQQGSTQAMHRPVPLLDFRYTMGGRGSVLASGVLMYDGSSSEGPTSITKKPLLLGLMIGGAVLGVACLTEVGICKDGSDSSESPGL